MVTFLNFIVFVLSLIMTGSILYRNKKVDSVFILMSVLVTINCMGSFLIANAKGMEMAIWANQFLYVGGCYAPLLMVVVLGRLCNCKMPRFLSVILFVYSSVVMALVMTNGKCGLYYTQINFVREHGYSYLDKTYAPLHILYPIMMVVYCAIFVFYLLYALKRRNQISFQIVMTTASIAFVVAFLYIFEKVISSHISLWPIGYLYGTIMLMKHYERINMYDMSANIANSIERMKEYGYIVFDKKYRYICANEYIVELFPEIKEWVVDSEVKNTDSYLYREVVQYLLDGEEGDSANKIISVNDRFFEMNILDISYRKKENVGFLLEFIDRTLEKKYYNTIEDYNTGLEKEVEQKTANILHIKDMMVLGMAEMVESRDSNTGGHIKRTSEVIKVFSAKLKNYYDKFNFDDKFLHQVEKAAPMHDLGKIAIDDVVLRKPGKYTDEEYEEMKRHSAEGATIVENILRGVEDDDFVEIAKNVAHYHHEKWNGQGYPSRLSETDIPIEARIMALADVFDALVSKRCYKDAFSYDKAFTIIEESLGEHFDPELGKVFLACRPELESLYDRYR